MDILIVSDTHGKSDRLAEVVARVRPTVLLFLGDGLRDLAVVDENEVTVRAVRGNCDWFMASDLPLSRVEVFGSTRIFMTHGHALGVKGGLSRALVAAAAANADVLLYGHTHVPLEQTYPAGYLLDSGERLEKPLLVVCPGSLGEPRDRTPTFATLTIRENGILAGFGKL